MGKRTDEKQSKRGKVEKKEKVKDKKPTKNDLAKTDKKDRPNPKKAEEKKAAVKVSKDKSQKKSASSKVPKEEQKKAAAKTDKKDLAVPEKKHDKDGGSKKVKKATPVQPVEKHEKKRKDKAECKNSKPPVLAIRDAPSRRCTTKTRPETEPDTSFMTPPEHVRRMSSPSLSQASDTSLAKYEREAEKANMNLEDYLQKVSSEELEKAVEARMKEIVETSDGQEKEGKEKEEQKDEDKEEEKEEEKSSSASSSDAEVSDASDDEEDVSASLGKEHEGIDEGLDGEPLSDDEGEEKSEAELDSDEEASEDEAASDPPSEDGIDEAEVEQQVQALVPIEKDVQQQDPAGKNSANANALTQAVATQRAAGESRNVDISKANSSNCKAEWDKFSRQCLDRRRFPVALAGHYQKDKLDLFRSWLSAKEDWSKVEVEIQRKAERTNKATKKRAGMKAREIMKAYPQKKALDLINRLRTNGLWAYDEDFDQDEEEIFYFNSGSTFKCEDATSESMAIKASETGNKDLIESLTGEGGPLQAGLLPAAPVKNEKALHDAFGDATKAVKTPKPKKGDSTEKAEPKTFEQIVTEKMEACLKKGGEGRRHAISLEAVEYSGDLAKKLMAFSAKMEKVYKKLQELCSQKSKDPKEYQKLIDIIDEKLAWFEKAEAAAKSLQSGMNPRPKKKAKTRQSGKAEKDTTDAAADGNSAITP